VLGDVDGDGTLEIALWDTEYMYILKSNVRTLVQWPVIIRPESAGPAPVISPLRQMESALVADVDGDGDIDVLFPLDDGTLVASAMGGTSAGGFPRVGPSEMGTAPSLAQLTGGAWSLVSLGANTGLVGLDAVTDSLATDSATTLSIQSLAGTVGVAAWPMARADLARTGRASGGFPPVADPRTFDEQSFIIYPNPVQGTVVHARVATNTSARVRVSIYTMEGQEAVTARYNVNPNSLPNTPFDEAINVTALKSGIYLLRLTIDGSTGGGGSLVKPFAIRR
jgi:hypothetical protein